MMKGVFPQYCLLDRTVPVSVPKMHVSVVQWPMRLTFRVHAVETNFHMLFFNLKVKGFFQATVAL